METNRTITLEREKNAYPFIDNENDSKHTTERLDSILAANAEFSLRNEMFKTAREELESEMMSNPMSSKKAFSYFGLLLGSIPPFTIFSSLIIDSGNRGDIQLGMVLLFCLVNIICGITGYFTGKSVGKIVSQLEKQSWLLMLLAMPFVGIFWGLISGSAGGLFIFIIGAIFGAIVGGMVGGVALPAFTILHRIFKRGDKIESKHFYPIALGITGIISAFILSL